VISRWITPDERAFADEITSKIRKYPEVDVIGHKILLGKNKAEIAIRDLTEVL